VLVFKYVPLPIFTEIGILQACPESFTPLEIMPRCSAAGLGFRIIPAGFNAPLEFLTGFTFASLSWVDIFNDFRLSGLVPFFPFSIGKPFLGILA